MDDITRDFVGEIVDPDELQTFAELTNITDEIYVQQRLQELRRNIATSNTISGQDRSSRLGDAVAKTTTGQSPSDNAIPGCSHQQFGGNDEEPYTIERTGQRRFARATAIETTYRVRFNNQWRGERVQDLRNELHEMFEGVIERAREGLNDNDLMRVIIRDDALNHPIVVPLRPANELNADIIQQKVSNVLQSEQNLAVDDSFEVIAGALHMPQGQGRCRIIQTTGPDNSIYKKKSMVMIVNDDKLCLARAIGICVAKISIITDTKWDELTKNGSNLDILLRERKTSLTTFKNITRATRNEQRALALKLCDLANVSTNKPASLADVSKFEMSLKLRIAVVSASLGNRFVRVPNNEHVDWPLIYLYLVDHKGVSHFHSITSITGFFANSYFCQTCWKTYGNATKHQCETTCLICRSQDCRITDYQVPCPSCNMTCRSPACFERHKTCRRNRKDSGDDHEHERLSSPCQTYWRCATCKKVINRIKRNFEKEPHKCGEWFCESCGNWVSEQHLCYIYPDNPREEEASFIFFDFETTQDTIAQCESGYCADNEGKCKNCDKFWCGRQKHVPNFVVAQSACSFCAEQPLEVAATCIYCGTRCPRCDSYDKESATYARNPCEDTCGFREVKFKGENTTDEFGKWLFRGNHRNVTVIAHNMKGYDGIFILEYLLRNSIRPSKIIYNGSKIMFMEVSRGLNIRIIDSLNFFPSKLASLPGMFGFQELRKGYFPHFFNIADNQEYVGPYPEAHYYGDRYMNGKDRDTFLKWHTEKTNIGAVFDFQHELESYCRSDVDILRRACLQFRTLLLQATGIEPFRYITIASVCMGVYKSLFLETYYDAILTSPEGNDTRWLPLTLTFEGWKAFIKGEWQYLKDNDYVIKVKKRLGTPIAQVPSGGYVQKDVFSKASIEWLEHLMHEHRQRNRPIFIRHALNGGEKKIPGTSFKVDGFCQTSNTVYEYLGCMWHGCKECYPEDRQTTKMPRTKQSIEELYTLTLIKKRKLRDIGYNVVYIWEHQWLSQRKDKTLCQFVRGLDIQARLDPRDSFYGGRTDVCKLYYRVTGKEKIKYVDFTSLYPYVNKYGTYPTGHPEIIPTGFRPLHEYFGLAKLTVLAPRRLYHPVLPYRCHGKLKFPLCRSCADEENIDKCYHTDNQRALTGTWCTPEIQVAIRKGYSVLRVYEVYHFSGVSKYDPVKREGGLFAQYVNTFLKFKQESSDWPAWCKTEDSKATYIREYLDKEGVSLDPNKISKNPGLRALAKLCLNSFWGKFGQRLNQGSCTFYHESELDAFFQTLTDPSKQVNDFHIVNDENIQLEWEHQNGFVPEDMKTNIFLATFTTSFARLKLYDVLDKLAERVLYYDTDSVIYVTQPDSYESPLGDYLGELTNELDDDDYIREFVSGGPKNYTYSTNKGKQVCKIRGFSLNYENSQVLNFDKVKEMVVNARPIDLGINVKRSTQTNKAIVETCNPTKITRDKTSRIIYNREEKKKYQILYDKRVIQDTLDTLPFGF